MRKKQRIIAGASLAAGLVAGGGAGLVIGAATGSAGAESPASVAVADPSTSTPDSTPPTDPSGTATPKPTVDREQRIRDLLQPLVDDGTITAAQLDAIVAKLDAAGPAIGAGHGGPGGRDGKRGIVGMGLDTVATTLGMTEAEVRTALESGTSLKELAESKGKTAQDLIDALVAETKSKLDEQVTNGKLTQAEADTMLATATTFITDAVNNGFPKGFPMGGPGREHRREAKPDAGSGTGSDSTPSSTPSTTTG